MPTRRTHDRRGAALPAVLLVTFWLIGVTGWLVAHTMWDQRVARVEHLSMSLDQAADAMAEAMAVEVGRVADWAVLAGAPVWLPCPAGGAAVPPAIDLPGETARLQAGVAAMSRWTPVETPTWQYVTGCDAAALLGAWRGPETSPWVLAWVAAGPGAAPAPAPLAQLVLHVVAVRVDGGRRARTVTLRRFAGEAAPRIVGWRPG